MNISKTNEGNLVARNTKIPDEPLSTIVTATAVNTAQKVFAIERDGVVYLKADEDNSENIYIGGEGVLVTTGYKLGSGVDFPLAISNVENLYFVADNTTDKLSVLVIANN